MITAMMAILAALLGETYDFSDSRKLVKSAEGELVAFWRAEREARMSPADPARLPDEDAAKLWTDKRREAEAASPLLNHTLCVKVWFERHSQDEDGNTYVVARVPGTMDRSIDESDMRDSLRKKIAEPFRKSSLSPKQERERERNHRAQRASLERGFYDRAKQVEHFLWIEMPPAYVPPVRPERRFEAYVLINRVEYATPQTDKSFVEPEQEFPYMVIRGALVRSDDLGYTASGPIRSTD